MNITSILKGIENFALEVFIWLIFIPKTLFKIITRPKDIPGYITDELKKTMRFEDRMSPVLLYLTVCVLLYASLRFVSFINPNENFTEIVQGPEGLLFLFFPLLFVLITGPIYQDGFKKETLTRNLYIQCYYFSILMLFLISWRLLESTNLFTNFGDVHTIKEFIYTYTSLESYNFPFILFTASLIWFIYIEIWLIRRETSAGKIKAGGIVIFYFLVLLAGREGYTWLLDTNVYSWRTGEPLSDFFRVEDDAVFAITVNDKGQIPKRLYTEADAAPNFRIHLQSDSDDLSLDQNGNTYSSIRQSLDGLHISESMALIDYMRPNSRVNFTGVEGDSLYFKLHLLDDPDGKIAPYFSFDILDNTDASIMYDTIAGANANWEVRTIYKADSDENSIEEIILGGLVKETKPYDLIIKSNYNGRYELHLEVLRRKLMNWYVPTQNESYADIEKAPFFAVAPQQHIIKLNQVFQGNFYGNPLYFEGKKGDWVEVIVSPLPWDEQSDLTFNVWKRDTDGKRKSVFSPRIWLLANQYYLIYLLLFGPLVILLFRGLFRKPNNQEGVS